MIRPISNVTHSRKRIARNTIVPLVAIAALVLAGCAGTGGDDNGSDMGYGPGVTDDSIKIGIFAPYTGSASIYSKAALMAEAIYNDVNANGGINGRQIEIVTGDTNCDAAGLQNLVRKFVDQDSVFMIHGGSCSNAVVSAKPMIEQMGVPLLTVNAASAAISDPPVETLFHAKATVDEQIAAIGQFMTTDPDVETVCIAATSDEWGQGYVGPLESAIADTDLEIVNTEELDPEGGDMTPAIQNMINSDCDIAAVFAYPQPMTVFLQSARPQGLDVTILTGDGTRPEEQMNRLGTRSSAENFFSVYSYTAPLDDPRFDMYKDLFLSENSNLTWDTVALEGAVSAEFNVAVLEAMGDDLTWDNWIATAESLEFDSTVSGPLAFGEFDARDPQSRRPGIQLLFSALDPKGSADETVVVSDWDDWLSRQ